MFKSHLYRIIKNKISMITFFLICMIPMIEVIMLLRQQAITKEVFHPAFAFFLSASSIGHAPQIILFWFLPLFLLVMGTDDAIQDFKTGYRHIIVAKIGKQAYVLEKMKTSFFLSFTAVAASLLINLLIVIILFNDGEFSKGLLEMQLQNNELFTFSIAHPFLAVLFFSLLVCLFSGLSGTLGASMSLFFCDKKYAYAASFFIWFLLVLNPNSIMLLFQPFSEISPESFTSIFIVDLIILFIIPTVVCFYEVRFNEN